MSSGWPATAPGLRNYTHNSATPSPPSPLTPPTRWSQARSSTSTAPRTLVLNAGAAPLPRPIHRQTWQTFSRSWEVDVQHVSNWTREALLLPRQAGNVVIAISSGAAVNGSPLSGSYAGGQGHHTVHRLLRRQAGRRYPAFVDRLGPALTPEQVGTAIVDIVTGSADDRDASLLTPRPQPAAVMPSSPFGGVPPLAGDPEVPTGLTGTIEPGRPPPDRGPTPSPTYLAS
jgi:hypothetical protein